jgi:hypothetical protein
MAPAREKRLSLLVLAAVILITAIGLWPETSTTYLDRNDNISHFTLIQGMVNAIEQGRNPLDFWSAETVFGYPEIRVYQPLAHVIVVLVYFLLGKSVSLMTAFVWVRFLSLVLLPLTFYATARLLEMSSWTAVIAAAMSPLLAAPALYGMEWNSYIWRGFGLFPQQVATHFWLLTLGFGFQAVRRGKRLVLTGVLLGMTALTQFVYGYMGALTLCVLALGPDAEVRRGIRMLRTVVIGAVSALFSAFQLLAPVLDRAIMNRSLWEPGWKWDSWGAGQVLTWLIKGELLDYNRLPVLTILAAGGAAVIVREAHRTKRTNASSAFLLYGAVVWILVFFGRSFWGPVLLLLGVPADMHLHRVLGAVQTFLLLLAAFGLARLCREAARRWGVLAAFSLAAVVLAPAVLERAQYIAESNDGGDRNLATCSAEQGNVDAVLAYVRKRGGRVYPGLISSWGKYLVVGAVPMYLVLTENGIPTVSYLAHSLALPGDLVVDFDELKPSDYRLFNIKSLIAPAQYRQAVPKILQPRLDAGPFTVFDAPGNGYFDVVDAPAIARADKKTFYAINKTWIHSDWPEHHAHLWIDLFGNANVGLPKIRPGDPLPAIAFPGSDPGRVIDERQDGDVYQAEVEAARPSFALFKMTWHPNWSVQVDDKPVRTVMLSPGFLGVRITPGKHRIRCQYEPGRWKLAVLLSGWFCVLVFGAGERFGYLPGARKETATLAMPSPAAPALPKADEPRGRKRRARVK